MAWRPPQTATGFPSARARASAARIDSSESTWMTSATAVSFSRECTSLTERGFIEARLGRAVPAENRALLRLPSGFSLVVSDRDSRVYLVVLRLILCDDSNMPTALIVDDHAAFRA